MEKNLIDLRKIAEEREERVLFSKAAFSKDHHRFFGKEEDHRLPYKRDVDRIIHSKAYSRYVDKTQVVYLVDNDHISHRGLHVQLVSNFSRGIAEILGLNTDLVEAISLGHDVGHPPFGHEGEGYLSELSTEIGNGAFAHPWQSCRLYREIEPLNLGFHVLDGFLTHDGGMSKELLVPHFQKTWEDHFGELKEKKENSDCNLIPATLEGCLVKICDTISYISRDLEDAIMLGLITREEIPETILGKTNRDILKTLAQDIIQGSFEKEYITLSRRCFEALLTLRDFNFKKIYFLPILKVESKKIKQGYRILLETLLKEEEKPLEDRYLWQQFLHNKSEEYLASSHYKEQIVDFISGMTDRFFVETLKKMFIPSTIHL